MQYLVQCTRVRVARKKKQRHGLHGFALDQPSINGIGPINRSEYIGNGRKQSATVCIYYVYIINGDFMGILILTVYRLLTIYIYMYIYICIYMYMYIYVYMYGRMHVYIIKKMHFSGRLYHRFVADPWEKKKGHESK